MNPVENEYFPAFFIWVFTLVVFCRRELKQRTWTLFIEMPCESTLCNFTLEKTVHFDFSTFGFYFSDKDVTLNANLIKYTVV